MAPDGVFLAFGSFAILARYGPPTSFSRLAAFSAALGARARARSLIADWSLGSSDALGLPATPSRTPLSTWSSSAGVSAKVSRLRAMASPTP